MGLALRTLLAACAGVAAFGAWLLFGDPPFLADHAWTAGILQRAAHGPREILDHVARWGFGALVMNTGLLALLLWTRRAWLVRDADVRAASPPPAARWPFTLVVLAAVGAAVLVALPRLDQSLWDDEAQSIATAVHGRYREAADGSLRFESLPWWKTLWHYRTPNNHVPYSIAARIALDAHAAASGTPEHLLDERVARLPALAFGASSLAALALFLRRLGYAAAGVLAAWLLALHPWHLRYMSEARGYSLLLLGVSLLLWLWARTWERGTWRRWGLFGAAQLGVLWTYPAAATFVLALNAAAAFEAARRGRAQLARLGVVGLAGAMIWLQMMGPTLPQFADYLREDRFRTVSGSYGASVLSHLLVGAPVGHLPADPRYPELRGLAATRPVAFWGVVALAGLAAAGGAVALWRRGVRHRLLLLPLLLPAPATWLAAWLRDSYLMERYVLYALPCTTALVCVGLTAPFTGSRARWRAGIATALAFTAAFAWLTQPVRHALRARSFQPIRESVVLTRGTPDPLSPAAAHPLTASGYSHPRYYDPRLRRLRDADALQALMERADRESRPLFVNEEDADGLRTHAPQVASLVLDSGRFREIAVLPAFWRAKTRHVHRYLGDASGAATATYMSPSQSRRSAPSGSSSTEQSAAKASVARRSGS